MQFNYGCTRQSRSNEDKPLGLCPKRMWLIITPVACVLVMFFAVERPFSLGNIYPGTELLCHISHGQGLDFSTSVGCPRLILLRLLTLAFLSCCRCPLGIQLDSHSSCRREGINFSSQMIREKLVDNWGLTVHVVGCSIFLYSRLHSLVIEP